jgi:drug/metabolite transporter (DMT)-like permease
VIDLHVAGGFVAALGASACFEVSYALQALEARRVHQRHELRASLLSTLARRPRWAAGIALGAGGWGLQIAALSLAPLTLVQPVLAVGLLLLMYLGVRWLGERIGPRELGGAAAIVVGVAVLALAAPNRADADATALDLGLALGVLGAAALGPYVMPRRLGRHGALLVASAGGADAAAAVAAKLVSDALSQGRIVLAVVWAATAAGTVLIGLLSETTALQRLPATRVAPLVLVLQVIVPVLLAPLVFHEKWGSTPLGGGVIAMGLALVAAGTVALASSSAIGDLLSREAREDERGR